MRDLSKKTFQISLGAMLTVLSLLLLYCAALLPAGRVTLYFLSSLMLAPLLYERQPRAAFFVYLATGVLSLLVLPGLLRSVPYLLLFGHYGIGKYHFEERHKPKRAYLYKWIYYNFCMAIVYLTCFSAMAGEGLQKLALPWLILGAQAAFVAFDFAYSQAIRFYGRHLRRILLGN